LLEETHTNEDEVAAPLGIMLIAIYLGPIGWLIALTGLEETLSYNIIYVIINIVFVFAFTVTAYGLWHLKKWGFITAEVVLTLNMISYVLLVILDFFFPDDNFPYNPFDLIFLGVLLLTFGIIYYIYQQRHLFKY
jgi:hypothetical protein